MKQSLRFSLEKIIVTGMAVSAMLVVFLMNGWWAAVILAGLAFFPIVTSLSWCKFSSVDGWLMLWTVGLIIPVFLEPSNMTNVVPSVITVSAVALGIWTATILGRKFAVQLLVAVLAIVCWGALAMGVLYPETALTSGPYEAGSLTGPYTHRNVMGFVSAIGTVAIVLQRRSRMISFPVAALLGAGPILALIWSGSRTAWIAALASTLIALMAHAISAGRIPRTAGNIGIAAGVILTMTVFLVDDVADRFFGLFGRDSTITGRTEIWSAIISNFAETQPFGIGWGEAWTDGNEFSMSIWAEIGFRNAHSHQGLLDVVVRMGIIGAIPLVVFLVRGIIRFWRQARSPELPEAQVLLGIFAVVLFRSTTESVYQLPFVALIIGICGYWPTMRSKVNK